VIDEFVVPPYQIHHRAVHRMSDEQEWWRRLGINPIEVAGHLWTDTRLNDGSSFMPLIEKT
jgi:hypothetical protein